MPLSFRTLMLHARSWSLVYLLWIMVGGCAFGAGSGLSDSPSDGAISKEVEAKFAGNQCGALTEELVATGASFRTLVGTRERGGHKARCADVDQEGTDGRRV